MSSSVVVLGLGNRLLGDEGVGPLAVVELSRRYRFSPPVDCVEGDTAGLALLPTVLDAERLLILDAIRAGDPPGSLTALDGLQLATHGAKISPHEIGVGDLLATARLHGGPKEVVILGVEPETVSVRVGLSATVARSLPRLLEAAVEILARWGVTSHRGEAGSCTSWG